jgi:long-chain acyl-CoA synthetase
MLRKHVPTSLFNYTDRTFAFLPWTHCYGLLGECFSVLDRGASMGIYPFRQLIFPYFSPRLHFYNPTILFVVPRFLELIYNYDSKYLSEMSVDYRRRLWFGKNIKYIVSGGAKLDYQLKLYFFNTLNVKILQGYGCSEMSPMISLQTDFDINDKSVGKLLPDIKLEIDQNNHISVNGPNKFLGYLGDDNHHPDQFFYPGDLGYYRDDRLYITGRDSQFIKLSNGRFMDLSILENLYKTNHNFKQICIWQENNILMGFAYPSSSVIRTQFQNMDLFIYPINKPFLSIENETINMKGELCRMQIKKYFENHFNIRRF